MENDEAVRRSDAAKDRAAEVRRDGCANDKNVTDDLSSCKMKRETERISVMEGIKVKT